MAALTQDTKLVFHNLGRPQAYRMAGSTTIYRHAIVCLDANGFAVPAADATGLTAAVGLADGFADNPGADGAVEVVVRRGELAWVPTIGGEKLTQADCGRSAFVLDDNTVVKQAGVTSNIPAGEVINVADDEALIKIGVV